MKVSAQYLFTRYYGLYLYLSDIIVCILCIWGGMFYLKGKGVKKLRCCFLYYIVYNSFFVIIIQIKKKLLNPLLFLLFMFKNCINQPHLPFL